VEKTLERVDGWSAWDERRDCAYGSGVSVAWCVSASERRGGLGYVGGRQVELVDGCNDDGRRKIEAKCPYNYTILSSDTLTRDCSCLTHENRLSAWHFVLVLCVSYSPKVVVSACCSYVFLVVPKKTISCVCEYFSCITLLMYYDVCSNLINLFIWLHFDLIKL